MVKIFISYRRADTDSVTDRIYQRLAGRFGAVGIFKDIYSISPGRDFRRALEEAIDRCDVLLAVIGSSWVDAADTTGRHRLHEHDHVRIEIERALARKIHVIPVLIDTARMPGVGELPPPMAEFAYCQEMRVRTGRYFDRDIEDLIGFLGDEASEVYAPRPSPSPRNGLGDSLFVLVLATIFPWLHWKMVEWGWARRPPELAVVNNYLNFFAKEMKRLNRVDRYIPLGAVEGPGAPPPQEAEYAQPQTRPAILKAIRRTIRLLSGVSAGGDQATAQLASLNRDSRLVRNVAGLLRSNSDPIILLGDPGSGKSTTMREVGLQIALSNRKRVWPAVPIYVPLGKYKSARGDRPGDVEEFVRQRIPKAHAGLLEYFDQLKEEGRLIILFDGMDEMERRLYGARVALLSKYAGDNHPAVRTLYACRTNDFSPKFVHRQLVLLEYDRRQVRQYLIDNFKPLPIRIEGKTFDAHQLAHHLTHKSELAETARNPLTLYLLCNYLRDRKAWPQTRHDLFDHHLRALFNRLRDDGERLPEAARPRVFEGWAQLAYLITIRHAGTSIRLDDMEDRDAAEAVEAARETGLSCGLVVRDESDDDTIRFVHHRLQEYLTARFLDSHGAGDEKVDWKSLIDTPRWQEVLINLASIQQERSEALRIVRESMQSIADRAKAAGDAKGRAADAGWRWPVAEERLQADRVVLASRIIRELGQNQGKLPPRFLETFTQSVELLAGHGRPTTQVKMLWAWGNTADVCPRGAIAVPLDSPIDWVREQALSVVVEPARSRKEVDADMRLELVIDLTNGRLLRRLGIYRKAIITANAPELYRNLGWAVGCELVYLCGLLALFFATHFIVFDAWPITQYTDRVLPNLGRTGLALALSVLSLTVAGLLQRAEGLGFWRWAAGSSALLCALIYLAHRIGAGGDFFMAFLKAAVWAGLLLGVLASGRLALFWLKFGWHLLPGLLRDRRRNRDIAFRIARKNSLTDVDRGQLSLSSGVVGLFVAIWVLGFGFSLLSSYVLRPTWAYVTYLCSTSSWPGLIASMLWAAHTASDQFGRDVFYAMFGARSRLEWGLLKTYVLQPAWAGVRYVFSASPWPTTIVALLCAALVAHGLRTTHRRVSRKLGSMWRRLVARLSWDEGTSLAAQAGEMLWTKTKESPRLLRERKDTVLGTLGCIGGMTLLGLVMAGGQALVLWLEVDTGSSQLAPSLILLALLSLVAFAAVTLLRGVWQELRTSLPGTGLQRALSKMKAEEWASYVKGAEPKRQFLVLSQTHYAALELEPHQFLRVLEGLEKHILKEPAVSQYWKTRHLLEEISRQESLNTITLDREPPPPPQPAPEAAEADDDDAPPETPDQVVTAEATPPAPATPWHFWARWALILLLVVVGACFAFDLYVKRHRVIYVLNGLPEQVEVEIDGGGAFSLESGASARRFVAEGKHTATYRAGGQGPRTQEFELTSAGFTKRVLDDQVYVVNLGGAAILRHTGSFDSYANGVYPLLLSYHVGEEFAAFPRVQYLFTEAPSTAEETATELRLSPELPGWVFRELPSVYSDAQKLELAEAHLRQAPHNARLLEALDDFATEHNHTQRFRDFLRSQMEKGLLPIEWYEHWQNATLRLEGLAAAEQLRPRLEGLLPDTPQGRSVLPYLTARRQDTLTGKLKYYDEAIQADPRNAHAWFRKCMALKHLGRYEPARQACIESRDLYRKAAEEKLESEWNGLDPWLALGLRWNDFFGGVNLEILNLHFALRDYDAAPQHFQAASESADNYYWVHVRALALDVLRNQRDAAVERQNKYAEEHPQGAVAVARAYLHYFLQEFDEQLRAAGEISEAGDSAFQQASAHTEFGNYAEAELSAQTLSAAARGRFSLYASLGLGVKEGGQPNRLWRKAEAELRESAGPVEARMAAVLASPDAPALQEIIELDLTTADKAVLLLAVAQRFPALRREALGAVGTFTYTPFPPGHFLRRLEQDMKRIDTGE